MGRHFVAAACALTLFIQTNAFAGTEWEQKTFASVSVEELNEAHPGINLPKEFEGFDEDKRVPKMYEVKYHVLEHDLDDDGEEEIFLWTYKIGICGAYNCPLELYAKVKPNEYRLVQTWTATDSLRIGKGRKGNYAPIAFPMPNSYRKYNENWGEWHWDGKEYKMHGYTEN